MEQYLFHTSYRQNVNQSMSKVNGFNCVHIYLYKLLTPLQYAMYSHVLIVFLMCVQILESLFSLDFFSINSILSIIKEKCGVMMHSLRYVTPPYLKKVNGKVVNGCQMIYVHN